MSLGRPRADLRAVLNAIHYVTRSGAQWRMVPRDLVRWGTAWSYFRRWRDDGTWQQLHDHLRADVRRAACRDPQLSAAIPDSQSVKSVERGEIERGFDGGKLIKGRKRHLLVDALGLMLIVGRSRQLADPLGRSGHLLARNVGEHLGADRRVWPGLIQQDQARFAEAQRGGIQVAQRAESSALAVVFDTIEHVFDQRVEDVERVVQCGRLELVGKCQQGGNATWLGHPRDRLGAGGGSIAGQNLQPSWGQAREVDTPSAERADFIEPLKCIHQGGRVGLRGRCPQSIEWSLASADGNYQQILEMLANSAIG
jgi:transposase